MRKPRPSNIIINISVAIALVFGLFAIAAIINHVSQQSQQNKVEIEELPRWKLSQDKDV